LLVTASFSPVLTADVEWTAHRGGPARTGNIDGKPGPGHPKVLWVQRSKEQFLAPLSVGGDRLFATVMGAFNSGGIHAFELGESKPPLWSKGAPGIKLPTVGSPVSSGGRVVFGEGMHQTDGSALHCLRVSDGRPLWRLDVPGELVHIEASPSISGGKVYVGSGNGGVICVDLNQVTLNGKDLSAADAEKELDAQWKKLSDAYEIEKKKDPDFAIPPNEASLPKPAPKVLWQVGKGAWHVDAPVLVSGDKVFVSSAYLDKEKLGERALICLNSATGAEQWKAPLKFNSWAGATLAGDSVIVPCSTIRYDPKELPSAKGEVVALKAADGKVEWRKDMTGAILPTAAAVGDVAIVCDTEGQVRALDLKSGSPKWSSKCGAAFFAGPAVAGDAVYVADIDGVVFCLGLSDGKPRWKLDLGADATVKAPGMVYGSPIVHGGKLYVGTSTLEGKAAGGETVVVCIGEGK
ncbi:MAG TPA: PQQ-binding-like beta-propeller repeat protein, partial [Planctomycetota bacterium]|nr:PQQ-binding-like beta-propeller repeat protein [Planctomycetota bacterium]